MRQLLPLLVALFFVLGCGGQSEINPIPTPLARPDDGLILVSASGALRSADEGRSTGMVTIVGLPESVEPDLRIVVENGSSLFAVEGQVGPDGSFALVVPAAAGDRLEIRPRRWGDKGPVDGPAVEREVPLSEPGINPRPPQEYIGAGPNMGERAIVATLEGEGVAVVRGREENVPAGLELVVGNPALSAFAIGTAEADGSFAIEIPARRGDLLTVFVRQPDAAADDPTSASEAISVVVE